MHFMKLYIDNEKEINLVVGMLAAHGEMLPTKPSYDRFFENVMMECLKLAGLPATEENVRKLGSIASDASYNKLKHNGMFATYRSIEESYVNDIKFGVVGLVKELRGET